MNWLQKFNFELKSSFTSKTVWRLSKQMSEMGLTARTIAKAYQSLRLGHKPFNLFSHAAAKDQIYLPVKSARFRADFL